MGAGTADGKTYPMSNKTRYRNVAGLKAGKRNNKVMPEISYEMIRLPRLEK